jgi:tRNA(adenine34) deaminase
MPDKDHNYWMKQAIKEAAKARGKDEVPIGCVIVRQDHIIARGHNLRNPARILLLMPR